MSLHQTSRDLSSIARQNNGISQCNATQTPEMVNSLIGLDQFNVAPILTIELKDFGRMVVINYILTQL